MRRFFVIIAVLILLVCMAVPAFAIGESGQDDSRYYAPLKLDVMEYEGARTTYTMPYPFNSTLVGSAADFSYFDGLVSGSQTTYYDPYDRLFSRGEFVFPIGTDFDTNTLILKGGLQVCSLSVLEDSGFKLYYDLNRISVSRVYVGFHYAEVEKLDGNLNYSIAEPLYYGNVGYVSGGYANIGSFIAGVRSSVSSDTICITDIEIRIYYDVVELATPKFTFETRLQSSSVTNPGPGFNSWFASQHVKGEFLSGDIDMFDWIRDSAIAFMDFEIIPGLAFSKIYVLFLTIGILMFFLKVVK